MNEPIFEIFLRELDEIIANQPKKYVGEAAAGYWMAIHAIRNAAHTAKWEWINQ